MVVEKQAVGPTRGSRLLEARGVLPDSLQGTAEEAKELREAEVLGMVAAAPDFGKLGRTRLSRLAGMEEAAMALVRTLTGEEIAPMST
jgi:hypothetical protein